MNQITEYFTSTICQKRAEGSYRHFLPLTRLVGESPIALTSGKEITVWCSNDYLGISQNPLVINAIQESLLLSGAGAGGTRNIAGTSTEITRLEAETADFLNKEAALVFASGYNANQSAIAALAKIIPDCVFISDEMNHASIIDGVKLAKVGTGAECKVFKHNSSEDLKTKLENIAPNKNKILLIESVYSMDGDIAPLKELIILAKQYGCLIFVDETHAVGLYGEKGSGVVEERGLTELVDILQGGFGKAVGVTGGYIAGDAVVIDAIRSTANSITFSTALPPYVCAGVRESLKQIQKNRELRETFFEVCRKAKAAVYRYCEEINNRYPVLKHESHIIPLIFGSNELCNNASKQLLEGHNIYLQPIKYPTVAKGSERFRITPNATHSEKDIERLVEALSVL